MAETNGIYQLPAGEYHYTIACPGYKGVNGDFTVEKSPGQHSCSCSGSTDILGWRDLYRTAEG